MQHVMRMRLLLIAGDHIHKVIKKPGPNILLSNPGLRVSNIVSPRHAELKRLRLFHKGHVAREGLSTCLQAIDIHAAGKLSGIPAHLVVAR